MKTARITAKIALLIAVAFIGAIAYLLVGPPSDPDPCVGGKHDVEIFIVGGEFDGMFGFGTHHEYIGSPGPNIHVKEGQIVRIVFRNTGAIPHTFLILEFSASVGDVNNPILPGEEVVTCFVADQGGPFSYQCSIPGHTERGMYGTITVGPKE